VNPAALGGAEKVMIARPQSARLMLLGLLGCLTAGLTVGDHNRLWADLRRVPARTAQFAPVSPEPPLAGAPVPPPAPAVPPLPAVPPAEGTAYPQDPPVPVVALRVRVPATVAAGQELEYHLFVENRTRGAAHHVLVRNPMPANAVFVRANPEPAAMEPEILWQLGTLAGCESREIVLVLRPTGTGDVDNCARVQFEHGECVRTRITRPAISLRKCGPAQAVLNDTLTYQLVVTNTGTAEVTGLRLTDTLPAGLEHSGGKNQLNWDLGRLAPGQSRQVEYQAVARAAGRLCNRAAANAAGGLHQEAESCVTVTAAKLSLSKTGPARRYVNQQTTYRLTASNTGDAALTNVRITDPVPDKMTFVRANAGGTLVGNQVQWTVGTLEPGGSRSVDVVLRTQAPGKVCNRATAAADHGLSAQAEACTEFSGVAALLLEVVDTVDPVEVGGETTYKILVRNQGSDNATHVRITAVAPAQEAVVRARGPAANRKDGQKISYEPMTLKPGQEVTYEVFVKAMQAGDVRFHVELSSDQLTSGPVVEEESTFIYAENSSTGLRQPQEATPGRRRTER
jgi:uncharacterized repeat protein (TIGR01451 family)